MKYFEVSSSKRIAQVSCAIIWCIFAGGPIFGFAALKPFLIKEGVYQNVCIPEEKFQVTDFLHGLEKTLCTEQDLKLNFIFTVSAVLTNVSSLPIGYILDFYGPKVCSLIGSFFLLSSCIILINTKFFLSLDIFDPYLAGFGLLALGGPFTYISSFQLSNSFPINSGTILALLTGAFDASSATFVFYKIINNLFPKFLISDFFKFYLVIPIFIVSVQFLLMEKDSYLQINPSSPDYPTNKFNQSKNQDVNVIVNETTSLLPHTRDNENIPNNSNNNNNNNNSILDDPSGRVTTLSSRLSISSIEGYQRRRSSLVDINRLSRVEENLSPEELLQHSGGLFNIMAEKPLKSQYLSAWFILITLFTVIQMLRLNYFISTINSQYTYLFDSNDKANDLNRIFDILLPLGGIISIPFVGYFLDTYQPVTVLTTLSLLNIVIGVSGIVKNNFFFGILNVSLFVLWRPFFYTTVSDFVGKIFGFLSFGIIYGSIMSFAGIFNYCQKILDVYTHTIFNMNPIPINLILITLTFIISSSLIIFVNYQASSIGKKKLAEF
ncbi:Fmp42p ASCRUDRAFT_76363 [Ascoidea rubescens DSM 1968]|uniref:MFS general substrate transporter n=1 Tax=Ascoidea rubescens DSM 1968 TaxID=1344418 RepID=A0A1D2VFG2_9ASCO|nr:hypothetical protein ASCRUDRAFT_76363 [Ascoidea rubescens DSM 1968]ODV60365.1 hypothetical protein ASCRUDRAFT_76363 [Ascoidea rubescens DSM 1968]